MGKCCVYLQGHTMTMIIDIIHKKCLNFLSFVAYFWNFLLIEINGQTSSCKVYFGCIFPFGYWILFVGVIMEGIGN